MHTSLNEITKDSPFHEGEKIIQKEMGVRDKMEKIGRKVIRDHLPEQHQKFYENQPFIIAATMDFQGNPWVSILAGKPGFIKAKDSRNLLIDFSLLRNDPFLENIKNNPYIGLIGIEFATRRRNRVNGRAQIKGNQVLVEVQQSFGNCPKFIQARNWEWMENHEEWRKGGGIKESEGLDKKMSNIISNADTFFIASAFVSDNEKQHNGADASHRGGKPGFVQVLNQSTLLFPDYAGNFHYNTLGNLIKNPKSGLLFWDFTHQSIIQLIGKTEILWDQKGVPGAERMIQFTIEKTLHSSQAIPIKWEFLEESPFLDKIAKKH